jgi:hypothetical protein
MVTILLSFEYIRIHTTLSILLLFSYQGTMVRQQVLVGDFICHEITAYGDHILWIRM